MTGAPSYTTVPGKLPDLLNKIRESGVPSKASNAWLETIGFKSSNDRSMLAVLRQIGLIDASGLPTPAWKQYRGAGSKAVLGRAIKTGYQDLFTTYPNAHTRSSTDISHVFSTQSDASKQTVDKMVSTFKTLAAQAEFDSSPTDSGAEVPAVDSDAESVATTVVARTSRTAAGLNVNINVQLALPETTDQEVYEAFFKAMRTHLLSDEP